MKRVHRKMNDLLRQQLIVQEKRISLCGMYARMDYYRVEPKTTGTYLSDRFKTKTL